MAIENYHLKFDFNQFNQENLSKIVSKFGNPKELRILYISTYRPSYTRTEALLELMDKCKINVTKILTGRSWSRYIKAVYNLIKYQKHCDLVFVAFRGHEILPILRLLTTKPIIFDALISVYDTLCFDRKIFNPNSVVGRLLKKYDEFLCRISQVVMVDTNVHKQYFEKEFGAKNVQYLYVGCKESIFRPVKTQDRAAEFTILWYGAVIPVHGIDVILKAAKLLEGNLLKFRLFGPIRDKYSALIDSLKTKNVEFGNFLPYEKLPTEINNADVCLGGHFSNINKAKRVIAGKTFEFLACEKPTIVGDNPASRELFKEGGLVHFVKMNDPKALADKILEIKEYER
jgi:glycosyltransferase involved in cell wall biosynthesis